MSNDRADILSAATEEFAEVGLLKARLDSIAARSGHDPGVVRFLFVDKAGLLRELLKEETASLVSAVALLVEEVDDPRELLYTSLQLYDQWLLEHEAMVRIFVHCSLEGAEALKVLYQQTLLPSEFYERLNEMIEREQLRCTDPFVLSLLFDSLIMFPHMLRSAVAGMNPERSVEQTLEDRFDAVMDLLEHGLFST